MMMMTRIMIVDKKRLLKSLQEREGYEFEYYFIAVPLVIFLLVILDSFPKYYFYGKSHGNV